MRVSPTRRVVQGTGKQGRSIHPSRTYPASPVKDDPHRIVVHTIHGDIDLRSPHEYTVMFDEEELPSNPNENCLEFMRCPHCEQFRKFDIDVLTTVEMTDMGSGDTHDLEYDEKSNCCCPDCGYQATVSEFDERSIAWDLAWRKHNGQPLNSEVSDD